jgi:hypothetical protein
LKIKILLILVSVLTVFIVAERESLIINSSLIYANLTHDMTHYSGDPAWVTRYNEAIWMASSGRYTDAKTLLAPLLNDTNISKKAEVAELYGDLIYTTSGSLDDVIHMYERSLSFAPSDRVTIKISYIKKVQQQNKNGSGVTENLSITTKEIQKTDSGSRAREATKIELQNIA